MTLQKLLILSALLAVPGMARVRLSSFCQQGGVTVMTSSQPSTNKFQQSYPGATVNVYYTGGASGHATSSGTTLTWTEGTVFNANSGWVGLTITYNGNPFVIASVASINSLTTTTSLGTNTSPLAWSMPATAPAAIYSDNTGTAKSNPYTCDSTTAQQFIYADNGTYDFRFSGAGIASPFTLSAQSGIDPLTLPLTVSSRSYIAAGQTFYQACLNAAMRGLTLVIDQSWYSISTSASCTSPVQAGGGIIQPASGQKVSFSVQSAPLVTICDIGAAGACDITSANGQVPVEWFGGGASATAANNSLAIKAMIASVQDVSGIATFQPFTTYSVAANTSANTTDMAVAVVTGTVTFNCNGAKIALDSPGTSSVPKDMFWENGAGVVTYNNCWLYGASTAASDGGGDLVDRLILTTNSAGPRLTGTWMIFEKTNVGLQNQGNASTGTASTVGNDLDINGLTCRNIIGGISNSTGYCVLDTLGALRGKINDITCLGLNYPTNNTSVMRHCAYFSTGATAVMTNFEIHDTLRQAISLYTGTTPGSYVPAVSTIISNGVIDNSPSADDPYAGSISEVGWYQNLSVSNVTITNSQGYGASFGSTDGAIDTTGIWQTTGAKVTGNTISGSKYDGIYIQGLIGAQFTNNVIGGFGTTSGAGIGLNNKLVGSSTPIVGANTQVNVAGNLIQSTAASYAVRDYAEQTGSAWNSGSTYNARDLAIGSNMRTYYSIAGGNFNHDPTIANSTYWADAMNYVNNNQLLTSISIGNAANKLVIFGNYPDTQVTLYPPVFDSPVTIINPTNSVSHSYALSVRQNDTSANEVQWLDHNGTQVGQLADDGGGGGAGVPVQERHQSPSERWRNKLRSERTGSWTRPYLHQFRDGRKQRHRRYPRVQQSGPG